MPPGTHTISCAVVVVAVGEEKNKGGRILLHFCCPHVTITASEREKCGSSAAPAASHCSSLFWPHCCCSFDFLLCLLLFIILAVGQFACWAGRNLRCSEGTTMPPDAAGGAAQFVRRLTPPPPSCPANATENSIIISACGFSNISQFGSRGGKSSGRDTQNPEASRQFGYNFTARAAQLICSWPVSRVVVVHRPLATHHSDL